LIDQSEILEDRCDTQLVGAVQTIDPDPLPTDFVLAGVGLD
jgi:hypothetical protein